MVRESRFFVSGFGVQKSIFRAMSASRRDHSLSARQAWVSSTAAPAQRRPVAADAANRKAGLFDPRSSPQQQAASQPTETPHTPGVQGAAAAAMDWSAIEASGGRAISPVAAARQRVAERQHAATLIDETLVFPSQSPVVHLPGHGVLIGAPGDARSFRQAAAENQLLRLRTVYLEDIIGSLHCRIATTTHSRMTATEGGGVLSSAATDEDLLVSIARELANTKVKLDVAIQQRDNALAKCQQAAQSLRSLLQTREQQQLAIVKLTDDARSVSSLKQQIVELSDKASQLPKLKEEADRHRAAHVVLEGHYTELRTKYGASQQAVEDTSRQQKSEMAASAARVADLQDHLVSAKQCAEQKSVAASIAERTLKETELAWDRDKARMAAVEDQLAAAGQSVEKQRVAHDAALAEIRAGDARLRDQLAAAASLERQLRQLQEQQHHSVAALEVATLERNALRDAWSDAPHRLRDVLVSFSSRRAPAADLAGPPLGRPAGLVGHDVPAAIWLELEGLLGEHFRQQGLEVRDGIATAFHEATRRFEESHRQVLDRLKSRGVAHLGVATERLRAMVKGHVAQSRMAHAKAVEASKSNERRIQGEIDTTRAEHRRVADTCVQMQTFLDREVETCRQATASAVVKVKGMAQDCREAIHGMTMETVNELQSRVLKSSVITMDFVASIQNTVARVDTSLRIVHERFSVGGGGNGSGAADSSVDTSVWAQTQHLRSLEQLVENTRSIGMLLQNNLQHNAEVVQEVDGMLRDFRRYLEGTLQAFETTVRNVVRPLEEKLAAQDAIQATVRSTTAALREVRQGLEPLFVAAHTPPTPGLQPAASYRGGSGRPPEAPDTASSFDINQLSPVVAPR